jgi:hypothetical protein
MLLTIVNTSGGEIAKEIVSTVEISQHGARVRGRRLLRRDWEGLLTQLSSGRQAKIRVVWQRPSEAQSGLLDSGVELLSGFDYWGVSFADPLAEAASNEDATGAPAGAKVSLESSTAQELIDTLAAEVANRPQVLEAVWCALVEQLEARQAISRADLISAIRSLAGEHAPHKGKPRENSREKK